MRVSEVMTPDVESISPKASLTEAADLMRDLDIGTLPVIENGRVVGMLTDRDIVVRCVAESCNVEETPVSQIMTRNVVTCDQNADVREAAQLMERAKIRRLVVVNQNDQPIGIVSVGDLAANPDNEQLSGEVLHEVCSHMR